MIVNQREERELLLFKLKSNQIVVRQTENNRIVMGMDGSITIYTVYKLQDRGGGRIIYTRCQ
jgi:hypothetical protein